MAYMGMICIIGLHNVLSITVSKQEKSSTLLANWPEIFYINDSNFHHEAY